MNSLSNVYVLGHSMASESGVDVAWGWNEHVFAPHPNPTSVSNVYVLGHSVASGSGVDVAWGWNEHVFAVVEAPAVPRPMAVPPPSKSTSKKAAAKEAEIRWV